MAEHIDTRQNRLLVWLDAVTQWCCNLGVYMLIFVTAALSYETVARYFFHAPTQWTQDVSTSLQIWFTYLGMALVLREGRMIRITAILAVSPRWLLYVLEALALLVVLGFGIVAVTESYAMLADSIRLGRRQPTMLALPNWISELPVVLGFALLTLQTMVELVRLPYRGPPVFKLDGEASMPDDRHSQA